MKRLLVLSFSFLALDTITPNELIYSIQLLSKYRETEEVNIQIRNVQIRQARSFKYLGSSITCITENPKSTTDIKQRVAQAKAAFNKKKMLLCSNNINLEVRKQLVKSLVWSIALYPIWFRRVDNMQE